MRLLSLCLGAFVLTMAGCDGGSGHSGRGESCRWRNDCSSGLACVNSVCTLNDFDVSTTAKSCDLIECSADEDCCELSPFCENLADSCEAGDAFSCSRYETECVCNEACRDNRCVFQCTSDTDCFGGACVGGTCVNCQNDSDCSGDRVCDAGSCVNGCVSTSDCPYLHSCDQGRCVETGCTTDRECIALSNNPRALCVDSECTSPCENDAECNSGRYRFQECVDGSCVYVGCDTDEECRIFLAVPPGSGASALCRE